MKSCENIFYPFRPAAPFFFFLFMAGIFAGNACEDHRAASFWVLILLFVFFGPIFYLYQKPRTVILAVLMVCSGYHSIQRSLYPDFPPHHVSSFLDSKKMIITGKVVSFARHYDKKSRIILACQRVETQDHLTKKIVGKINLSLYGHGPKVPEFGDVIRFKASIKSIQNFRNPGGFDYEKFLRLRGIYGSAYTDIRRVSILTGADEIHIFLRLVRQVERVRTSFYHFVLDRANHGLAGKILVSLVTGKKEILPPETRELFAKAGISHLLAISGLHLAIVSLLFFGAFYRIMCFFPRLLISGRSGKIAGLLTLIPLTLYAVFTGFSPSTQRALIMISVLLFSNVSERENDVISSLSAAGVLILILNPPALFSISFQLSFMAVIFILGGVSLLKKYGFRKKEALDIKGKILFRAGLMLGVSLFAGLGTAPLTAFYFNLVSLISVPANLIFIPLIGCVVLPLGLVSVLVFSSWPSLAVFLIHGCEHLIVFSIFISRFMVSLPGSWFRLFTLGYGQIAGLYLICLAAFFMLKKPGKIFASVLVVTVSSLALNFSYHGRQDRAKEELVMTVLDVGQGSSTLIQTAEGKSILVDGGGFSDSASFDTGRLIVAPVLWKNRITVLDYVILSHPEADHLNGLIFILENFKVHTFIQNTDEKITDRYETLVRICNTKGIPIWKPSAQGRKLFLGQTEIVFLRASPLVFFDDFNNNSLVFKLIYNQFTMLFPGDILAAREERLGRCDQVDLVSDILLSPHHGSRTSSSKFFLDKVQPKSVIVSCGRNNRYNFPHDEVLRRYGKMGITVYRTDADGAIFISSDGRNFSIKTYKGG